MFLKSPNMLALILHYLKTPHSGFYSTELSVIFRDPDSHYVWFLFKRNSVSTNGCSTKTVPQKYFENKTSIFPILTLTWEQKSFSICLNSSDCLSFKAEVNVPGKTAVPGRLHVATEPDVELPSPLSAFNNKTFKYVNELLKDWHTRLILNEDSCLERQFAFGHMHE